MTLTKTPDFQEEGYTSVRDWACSVPDNNSDTAREATSEVKPAAKKPADASRNLTFRVTESPIGPVTMIKVDEDIMRIVWLTDAEFFDTGLVDWSVVIPEIRRQCRWHLDVDDIVLRWKTVIYPQILVSRMVAAKFDEERRKRSNNLSDFPPLLDNELEVEMTDRDYQHSLGPYARLVIEKSYKGQIGSSPTRQKYFDPNGPKLEAKAYVPDDSEKPSTRGYAGTTFVGRDQFVGCEGEMDLDDQKTVFDSDSDDDHSNFISDAFDYELVGDDDDDEGVYVSRYPIDQGPSTFCEDEDEDIYN